MAIDSEADRIQIMNYAAMTPRILPDPIGAIDQTGRHELVYLYAMPITTYTATLIVDVNERDTTVRLEST